MSDATTPGTTGAPGTPGAPRTPGVPGRPRVTTRRLVVVGALLSMFLAGVVSFYASSHPDGLEFVADQVGFRDSTTVIDGPGSPFAGYATRGVDSPRLSGGVAGVVGATLVFVLASGAFLALRRRGQADPDDRDG